MSAFLFTLALFAFWGLIGFAILAAFPAPISTLQRVLLAPAVGMAAVVLAVFGINLAGVPIKDFGAYLCVALALVAVAALALKRPTVPPRTILPHLLIVLAALLLAANPMFSYSFDWVSFSNDDMANYALGAQRIYESGFSDKPDLSALMSGKDYSLSFWYFHVAAKVRPGSELMLAAVWAATGPNAHQVFMPLIASFHMALIFSAAAMVAGSENGNRVALAAAVLLGISPLTTLGMLYQLIGQVGGLAIFCAAVTLLFRRQTVRSIGQTLAANTPLVMVLSGLFIWYPEVIPFLGLGWLIFAFITWRQDQRELKGVVVPAAVAAAGTVFVLNQYLFSVFIFLFRQTVIGTKIIDPSTILFPYFLVPSGFPALWGFIPIASRVAEPALSISIAIAVAISIWFLRPLFFHLKRAESAAVITAAMLVVGAGLFIRNNDFGLFKLAMFIQPFLLGVLAFEIARLRASANKLRMCVVAVFLLACVATQLSYVQKSRGEGAGSFTEVPRASSEKVNSQFNAFFERIKSESDNDFIADTSNIVLVKYQALYTRGRSVLFPSRDYFYGVADRGLAVTKNTDPAKFLEYVAARKKYLLTEEVRYGGLTNSFESHKALSQLLQTRTFITTNEKQTIFNRYRNFAADEGFFSVVEKPENLLMFIHSDLGHHYYIGDRKKISYYQLESDPMFSGEQFSALGRHLLFMVVGESSRPRVVIEVTATVLKQFEGQLPPIKVYGQRPEALALAGRGSARIISSPLEFMHLKDISYMALDMGRDGRQFPKNARGLMQLFGNEVPLDQRRITAFGRNISLISEDQYNALRVPSALQKFPDDLAAESLEYSGIYEDGWISERSFFVLQPDAQSDHLLVKGFVPQIDAADVSGVLEISIAGAPVAAKQIGIGAFEIKIPISNLAGRQRIDLSFSRNQKLPGADGRVIGGKLEFIGFTREGAGQ